MSGSPEAPKGPGGRPTSFTEDLAEKVLSRMAEGDILTEICAEDGMPSRSTLFRWGEANPEFRNRYAHARELQAHAIGEGAYRRGRDAKDAALDRLAFDAGRWFAGRMLPRVYGDRQTLEHTGANGGPITTATITTDDPAEAARAYMRLIEGKSE